MANEARKRRWPWVVLGLFAALGVAGFVAGFVALSRLDAYLLARAQHEANAYSSKLGRRITIGDLKTTLLGGAGVRIDSVEVGAAEGEDESAPLLKIGRAKVELALWPAIASRGKDVQVRAVELSNLRVNVVQRKDSRTNLEELADRFGSDDAKTSPSPEESEPPRDLSAIRIDRASLTGEVYLLDQTGKAGPGSRELAVRELSLVVKDLRAGKPLEVALDAAVLAPARNLSVKLTTAPLPSTLMPTPEKLVVKLQPLDLAPLVPFFPASAGLRAGALDADLEAQLGGAVPGGSGPTKVVGAVHARGLRFADAEGGNALDAALEADLSGDAEKGDLELKRLFLALGPAEVSGTGSVKGLLGDSPAVKGLAIVGKNLDPELLGQYYPPLRKQLQGISGPLGLDARASGTAAKQSIAIVLDFTAMRLALPEQLAKAPGAPMKLEAILSGAAGGAMRFDAKADLIGADLRPGGQLDKAPGQPAEIALAGVYQPARGKGGGMKLDLSSIAMKVRGDAVNGTAKVETTGAGAARKTKVEATLKSARLDADALLLSRADDVPAATPAPAKAGSAKAKKAGPSAYDGLEAQASVEIAALRFKQTDFHNVTVLARLEGDRLELKRFKAGVHGGEVVLDGTQARLAPVDKPFQLKAKATGLSMAALMPKSVPSDLVTGRFSGEVGLSGAGTDTATLSKNLNGLIQGLVLDGSFKGVDIFGELAGPLAKALPFGGQALKEEVTSFGDKLPFGLEFANGVARLKKPLEFSQSRGSLKIDGGIDLTGTLDLGGTVALAPVVVQQLTKGKVNLNEPLPIGFKLTGPVTKPQVSALDLKPALALLAKQAAAQGLSELAKSKLGGKVAEKLEQAGLGGASAPASTQEAQVQAEEAARREAEEAKKRLQNKAKEKLKGLFR